VYHRCQGHLDSRCYCVCCHSRWMTHAPFVARSYCSQECQHRGLTQNTLLPNTDSCCRCCLLLPKSEHATMAYHQHSTCSTWQEQSMCCTSSTTISVLGPLTSANVCCKGPAAPSDRPGRRGLRSRSHLQEVSQEGRQERQEAGQAAGHPIFTIWSCHIRSNHCIASSRHTGLGHHGPHAGKGAPADEARAAGQLAAAGLDRGTSVY
jgi:hypothetical protein